ncbi:MAG: hypothetical protein SFX73_23750 [Kofleriaceae bacterium]|nr:hypothetical protein [Kofleriaceae bacterium]
MALQYKFVELSIVTDESLEACVNEWVIQGWGLEGIRFVMTESSKRPAMAFVSFIREIEAHVADSEAPRRPPPLVKHSNGEDGPRVITAVNRDDVE